MAFTNATWSAPCAVNNRSYTKALFCEVLGSCARTGGSAASTNPNALVDYWWTDWGGCESGAPEIPDLTHDERGRCAGWVHPTSGSTGGCTRIFWWGNYVFASDPTRFDSAAKRSLVLTRYGGLGSHRYPAGFSGDSQQNYRTLQFQIEMTPIASNVLFGWWSHDLGGFHNGTGYEGDEDPARLAGSELYLRWLQFGSVRITLQRNNYCNRSTKCAAA